MTRPPHKFELPHALLLASITACSTPAPGQLLVWVDTDAPLPGPSSSLLDPTPLFDSLRIDLYPPGAVDPCAGCSRHFSVEQAQFEAVNVSIGIVPGDAREGYRLRARLFTAAVLSEGEPRAASTVDMMVALPSVDTGEAVDVSVFLPTDDVARPRDSVTSPIAAAALGKPTFSRVGSWWGAQRVDCDTMPRPDEVCIPGGAYWMGSTIESSFERTGEQRLVIVSPFFLDKKEVTVASVRAWLPPSVSPIDKGIQPWSGTLDGGFWNDFCSYSDSSANDALPINCIPWPTAREHCLSRGADLPTEAQLEFVHSAFGRGLYPWGSDEPDCEDVVYGRAGAGYFGDLPGECRPEESMGGMLPAGRGVRDRLDLPGGAVIDMAGNLSEMARDRWESQDGACWNTGVFVDPLCDPGEGTAQATHRGGHWLAPTPHIASHREPIPTDAVGAWVGFRCARPNISAN